MSLLARIYNAQWPVEWVDIVATSWTHEHIDRVLMAQELTESLIEHAYYQRTDHSEDVWGRW